VAWSNISDSLQRARSDRPGLSESGWYFFLFFLADIFFSFSPSCTVERHELAEVDRCEREGKEGKEEDEGVIRKSQRRNFSFFWPRYFIYFLLSSLRS